MISIRCSCGGDFWVRDRLAGREAACPVCGTMLSVPPFEEVKRGMTPAPCSCGEVFWSSSWQAGKVAKCPMCTAAVGPSRTKSGVTTIMAPEARRTAGRMPETLSERGDEDRPPPDGEPETARRSAAVARRGRPPVLTHVIGPKAIRLAAGAIVLMVVGLLAVYWSAGPAAEGDDRKNVAPSTPLLSVLVPAYFYPDGDGLQDWNRLIEAAQRVPVVAIVNPASGPGKVRDSNYADVVRRAKAAGATVIGYVNTADGKRASTEIEADIDRWVELYPEMQGIFFDAQARGAEHVDLYTALRTHVQQKIKGAVLISSPGTICAEEYFSRSAVDVAVVFQQEKGFEAFDLPSWAENHPARRFAAIPYSVKTEGQMKHAVQHALLQGIGYLYVTDGPRGNPWEHLPLYWDAEVGIVNQVNQRNSLRGFAG